MALAHRLHAGLTEQRYRVLTPEGNRSAIVAFEHGRQEDTVRAALQEANIVASMRENGTQIRVGPALFNNSTDVESFLEVTEQL